MQETGELRLQAQYLNLSCSENQNISPAWRAARLHAKGQAWGGCRSQSAPNSLCSSSSQTSGAILGCPSRGPERWEPLRNLKITQGLPHPSQDGWILGRDWRFWEEIGFQSNTKHSSSGSQKQLPAWIAVRHHAEDLFAKRREGTGFGVPPIAFPLLPTRHQLPWSPQQDQRAGC